MPPIEVRKLVDVINDDDGRDRRNYAMLMMARLGMHAEEVEVITDQSPIATLTAAPW